MRCASEFQDSAHRFINMHCTDIVRDRMGFFAFWNVVMRTHTHHFYRPQKQKQQQWNKKQTKNIIDTNETKTSDEKFTKKKIFIANQYIF